MSDFCIEGVPYYRFRIAFTDMATKKRHRWVRYAPSEYFLHDAMRRELSVRGIDAMHVVASFMPRE